MYLQNQAGVHPFAAQAVKHPHHRNLDDVRRRPLNGRIERKRSASARVTLFLHEYPAIPAAVEEGFHITQFFRLLNDGSR